MCGASVVLFDLDLALADRSSRHHTLELLHRISIESSYASGKLAGGEEWLFIFEIVSGNPKHE